MRTRLSDAKDPNQCEIASLINIRPEDARFTKMINRAQRELIQTGEMFWGLFGRYAFCTTQSCMTWPRQIAAIETVSVCSQPIPVRNQWFEFLGSGPGPQSDNCNTENRGCCGGLQLFDRGTAPTFSDIIGTGKKIKVYADVAEDGDAVILLQGYDQNGNWIRTQVEGVWIDGEYVGISTTPQTSFHIFSSLVAVQKPLTNGVVRLYEYDTVALTQRALAIYEPDELNPSYRRSFISGISGDGCGCDSDDDDECETKTVEVMAKLEFIPAKNDNDWLLIGNLTALEYECQSILKSDCDLFAESAAWHAKAVNALRAELRHYVGNPVMPIRMQPRRVGGAAVRNMI